MRRNHEKFSLREVETLSQRGFGILGGLLSDRSRVGRQEKTVSVAVEG
jgi:hypothetical protein